MTIVSDGKIVKGRIRGYYYLELKRKNMDAIAIIGRSWNSEESAYNFGEKYLNGSYNVRYALGFELNERY